MKDDCLVDQIRKDTILFFMVCRLKLNIFPHSRLRLIITKLEEGENKHYA